MPAFINYVYNGLSPCVRGNRVGDVGITLHGDGSIPVRTGEPIPSGAGSLTSTVYPRAYGGT